MPDLKLYTIADLRAWLIDNNPPVGLTEQVIAPVRAYAILNNPYVRDDDAVVAAIYEGDELAAFTACFPDKLSLVCLQDPQTVSQRGKPTEEAARIWWASTLWCNPKFQGKGYGLIVIGSLIEAHEGEITLDRWGAAETVEIFTCLGYQTIYTPRYIMSDKSINRTTLRGKFAYFAQSISKGLHSTLYTIHYTLYTLKYTTFIDGEAYAFIQSHRNDDLFLREQTMLNWILRYPFMQSCPILDRVEKDTEFSANVPVYGYSVVKVYKENALVGVYILRRNGARLSVVYLYYNDDAKVTVFASIVEHILKLKTSAFETENKDLASYMQQYIYFPKKSVENISFSYPEGIKVAPKRETVEGSFLCHLGDGDSFA